MAQDTDQGHPSAGGWLLVAIAWLLVGVPLL